MVNVFSTMYEHETLKPVEVILRSRKREIN
jgi:hypothetical protein